MFIPILLIILVILAVVAYFMWDDVKDIFEKIKNMIMPTDESKPMLPMAPMV